MTDSNLQPEPGMDRMKEGEYFHQTIAQCVSRPLHQVSLEAPVVSLVANSFEVIYLLMDLQEKTGVRLRQGDLAGVHTVQDLILVLENNLNV